MVEAERLAKARTLTEGTARRLISEILERATGESIQFHTTREWLDEWCAAKVGSAGERTIVKYKQVCRDFLAHLGSRAELPVGAITPKDVRTFRDAMVEAGHSPSNINQTVRKVLISPFAAAQRLGYIQTNPCAAVELLKDDDVGHREVFSAEQILSLLRAASPDWRGVIITAYYTGLRLRDVTTLCWQCVNLDTKVLQVKTRKTGTTVTIPMHPDLISWLQQHPRGIGKAPVFPSLAGMPGTGRSGLSMQFQEIMTAAKIKGGVLRARKKPDGAGRQQNALTFHSLRHSFVSALANAGVPADLRQQLAGHTDERSHSRYTHHEIETMRAAIIRLPRMAIN